MEQFKRNKPFRVEGRGGRMRTLIFVGTFKAKFKVGEVRFHVFRERLPKKAEKSN